MRLTFALAFLILVVPSIALVPAGRTTFDTGSRFKHLFTGTIATVVRLVAILVSGYMFVHGKPRRSVRGSDRSQFRGLVAKQ